LLYAKVTSTLVGAKVDLTGQAQFTGDYQSQAQMTFTGFDVARPLEMFGAGNVKAQSSISGTATVSGPLKTPKALSGTAQLNDVDVRLQGIELKAAEPLRVSLRDGIATLEHVHITGQDTDMQLSGTAQLFGATDPRGGKLAVDGKGNVSMTLLHTFDPDVISSGRVEFAVRAEGQLKNPVLKGDVKFDDVNVALDGVPNGLSNMNGTLSFSEDRLQV
jgi:translocation and assembly module TamB